MKKSQFSPKTLDFSIVNIMKILEKTLLCSHLMVWKHTFFSEKTEKLSKKVDTIYCSLNDFFVKIAFHAWCHIFWLRKKYL